MRVRSPHSVGYKLGSDALVFGGQTLTCTDIAVAARLADVGDRSLVKHLNKDLAKRALATVRERISEAVDRMKTDAMPVPLLAVGGGAMLIPKTMPGINEVVHFEHEAVANAVGAAIAQTSGETDRIYRDVSREEAIESAKSAAIAQAIKSGASADMIKVIEVEGLPLSYLPGKALRARVPVVGEAVAR